MERRLSKAPTHAQPLSDRVRHSLGDILAWGLLLGLLGLIIVPIVFMLVASFMPVQEIFRRPFTWIPERLFVGNYINAIRGNHDDYLFVRALINSVLVCTAITISTVFLSALTGYSLAKLPFRGRTLILFLILATLMIPFEAVMIPLYLVIRELNLQDSYTGLIAPFLLTPFGVFLMRQTFISFPNELIDAARIDGASEYGIFLRVVLPNGLPAMAVLAVLTFQSQWDNLIWPLLVIQSDRLKTLPLYLVTFAEERYTDEGALIAVAALASLPMLLMLFTLSGQFLKGANLFSSSKG